MNALVDTRRFAVQVGLALTAWCWWAIALAADLPHADLRVTLDPATRALAVQASIELPDAQPRTLLLAGHFRVTRALLDGKAVEVQRHDPGATGEGMAGDTTPQGSMLVLKLSPQTPGVHGFEIDYTGTLAPLIDTDHRGTLGALPAMADARGSYLPAGSGWYPQPADFRFTYRVSITTPVPQRALVPGRLLAESTDARGAHATFAFSQPTDGIELMAAPYAVDERVMRIDGRDIRLRTYFHPEIAQLSASYLDSVDAYVRRYDALIGAYPFTEFSVVSSPLPTGFGMPGLTYLGVDVLRLPFIRATSLGHEVLHNWWGNGVYADYAAGNWAEGLTTFMADYAYKEDAGAKAGLEMRMEWLRDFAAVPAGQDTPLRAFTSRTHGTSQIVGYNKAAFVFFMLRDAIGEQAFADGLRRFWAAQRFQVAGWDDLRAAFEAASGRDLRGFFSQWLERRGAPRVAIEQAGAQGNSVRLTMSQSQPVYALQVPLAFDTDDGPVTRTVTLDRAHLQIDLELPAPAHSVSLDPQLRLFRMLAPDEAPPILRNAIVHPRTQLAIAGSDPGFAAAARALAERLLDHPPQDGTAVHADAPLLLIATQDALEQALAARGVPAAPAQMQGKGSAAVWSARLASGRIVAVIAARDAESLRAIERALPHYGRQSWLVFEGAKAVQRGSGSPAPQRLPIAQQ